MTQPRTAEEFRAFAIAAVEAEIAAFDAAETRLPPRSQRRTTNGTSTVFSLRLDTEELAALEHKAAVTGTRPTVLARNLIRAGLSGQGCGELGETIDRLAEAVAELRGMVP